MDNSAPQWPDRNGTSLTGASATATLHRRALMERDGSLKGLPEPVPLPRLLTGSLDPYVPSAQRPWNKKRAGYLLRRTMFGATRAELALALSKQPGEVVDMLLADSALPAAPGSWVNDPYWYDSTNNDQSNRQRLLDVRTWWTGLMLGQSMSIREKMTFFWHDHWATEAANVPQPHFNYWFIDLFRRNMLGNFRQMVQDVTVAPAMLLYLDGWYNTKVRPNENYARELLELHTLGEGNGYTEDDIKNAACALTGWSLKEVGTSPAGTKQYDPKAAEFYPTRHDTTDKTVFGQTGAFRNDTLVDLIFTQRAVQASTYICRKLYREFVYEIADETIISQLADILRNNNWDIRPVMSTLLRSDHFFEAANIGAHVTSPLEFYIGAMRSLDVTTTNLNYVYNVCAALGCQLLEAPNVKGWPGYRAWITASRLASRWAVSDELVMGNMKSTPKYGVDPVTWASGFPAPNAVRTFLQDVIDAMTVFSLSTTQFEMLLDKLLAGAPEYEWNISQPGADGHIKDMLKAVLRLSESQLC